MSKFLSTQQELAIEYCDLVKTELQKLYMRFPRILESLHKTEFHCADNQCTIKIEDKYDDFVLISIMSTTYSFAAVYCKPEGLIESNKLAVFRTYLPLTVSTKNYNNSTIELLLSKGELYADAIDEKKSHKKPTLGSLKKKISMGEKEFPSRILLLVENRLIYEKTLDLFYKAEEISTFFKFINAIQISKKKKKRKA